MLPFRRYKWHGSRVTRELYDTFLYRPRVYISPGVPRRQCSLNNHSYYYDIIGVEKVRQAFLSRSHVMILQYK